MAAGRSYLEPERALPAHAAPGRHPGLVALLGLIAVVATLALAKDVLVLLAIAGLLAFLLAPLVVRIQRMGLPRVPAVILVMTLALVAAAACGILLVREATSFVDKLPSYQETLREKVDAVRTNIADPLQRASRTVAEITRPGADSRNAADKVPEVAVVDQPSTAWISMLAPAGRAAAVLGSMVLVVVLASIALIGKESIRNRLLRLAGGGHLAATTLALDEASAKVSRYLLLTTLVNGSLGVCAGIALSAIGVPNALLWGTLFAILRFIPYLGVWIGAALPVATAFAVSTTWTPPLLAIGLFAIVELITSNAIEPWLYGARTGVSSGALIVAAVFWTWVWGIPGLLLSTPLTVCLTVIGKHVPRLRFLHLLLGNEPALPIPARLYQRLLSGDADEASSLVEHELEHEEPLIVLDRTVLPALGIAALERDEGALDAPAFTDVTSAMAEIIDDVVDRRPKAASRPKGSVPLLCVGAGDAADDAVAILCAGLLAEAGFAPSMAGSSMLTGEVVKAAVESGAHAVLISSFPPSGLTRVRYLCKRLAAALDPVEILVGIWGAGSDAARAKTRLPEIAGLRVVTTLTAALDQGRQIFESLNASIGERSSHVAVRSPRASV